MTEQDTAERMKKLLAYANYTKVGKAVGVSKSAVSDWANGRDVTPYRLEQVAKLLRETLADALDEPPAPAWAAPLASKVEIEDLAHQVKTEILEALRTNRHALGDELALNLGKTLIEALRDNPPRPADGSARSTQGP